MKRFFAALFFTLLLLAAPPAKAQVNSFANTKALQDREKDINEHVVKSVKGIAGQLSLAMTESMKALAGVLDAKMQMEAQMAGQRLRAQASKDYQPSEALCEFGTFVRSLPQSEERARFQSLAVNKYFLNEYMGSVNSITAGGTFTDETARLEKFRNAYCDPADNHDGLAVLCAHPPVSGKKPGAALSERKNIDIDYQRLVLRSATLAIDYNGAADAPQQRLQEDLLALGRNLYWPRSLKVNGDNKKSVLRARNLYAQLGVAHNSYATLIGLKSQEDPAPGASLKGSAFMKVFLKDTGLPADDIEKSLGKNPSYDAQMEVLTKKLFQNPGFFTALYDKPANVDRIGVALDALALMQNRDRYAMALRREMLTSILMENALQASGPAQ